MSELFLELYSEEMPPALQEEAKNSIVENFNKFFEINNLKKIQVQSYSTPKRLIFYFSNLIDKIVTDAKVLKGPKVGLPEQALNGFLKSNSLAKNDLYEEETDKGKFYFAKVKKKKN